MWQLSPLSASHQNSAYRSKPAVSDLSWIVLDASKTLRCPIGSESHCSLKTFENKLENFECFYSIHLYISLPLSVVLLTPGRRRYAKSYTRGRMHV